MELLIDLFDTITGFGITWLIGLILALIATVLIFVFIMPAYKRDRLGGFGRWLHDLFNFNFLFLEFLVKAIYVIVTLSCIFGGFFLLIYQFVRIGWGGSGMGVLMALGLMLLGPIVVRIYFELSMMFILLTKNTIQINKKLSPKAPAGARPEVTPKSDDSLCPHCHKKIRPGTVYCPHCGKLVKPAAEPSKTSGAWERTPGSSGGMKGKLFDTLGDDDL